MLLLCVVIFADYLLVLKCDSLDSTAGYVHRLNYYLEKENNRERGKLRLRCYVE